MNEPLHKHHIVPKHMGGLGPGHPQEHLNIMELSREDHAIAHLILYKLYGNNNDLRSAVLLTEGAYHKGLVPWNKGKKCPYVAEYNIKNNKLLN